MIDLHIHTKYSDGTDSVIDVLKKAENLKLSYISITDHDKCDAYEELKKIDVNKYYSGKIIPGVEIKCSIGMERIEVLGYKINTEVVDRWLKNFYKDKTFADLQGKYFSHFYDVCKKKGLTIKDKEDIIWDKNKDWASIAIYNEIKSHPENQKILPNDLWEDLNVFIRKYTSYSQYDFYVDKSEDYPPLEDVLNVIKNAGGIAFLAHYFVYKMSEKAQYLDNLINNYKFDGIECFYTLFSEEQTRYLVNFCKTKNLYISGGTDYHGDNRKGTNLGTGFGNLAIPDNIIKFWNKEE